MDKSRVEPTIFYIEKISFSLKLFSGHFYGQSFIKTVRGPLKKKSAENKKFEKLLSSYCKQYTLVNVFITAREVLRR